MAQFNSEDRLAALASLFADTGPLSFRILEVGAAPYGQQKERFHRLLDVFPGSQVIAFEVDATTCAELNRHAATGLRYFPVALGRKTETRPFYRTRHPQCSSLYEPNEELLRLYLNMEMASIEEITDIETVSLDEFVAENSIGAIDFIKMDIQGAELEVLEGGISALKNVVMLISEAEFIPHYKEQPLFGDVCRFLSEQGLMFHKFLGFGGRSLKPIVLDNNPNRPSQLLWSDSIFIRNIQTLSELSEDRLLKLGVFGYLYGSSDLAYYCFQKVDQAGNTEYAPSFLQLITDRD